MLTCLVVSWVTMHVVCTESICGCARVTYDVGAHASLMTWVRTRHIWRGCARVTYDVGAHASLMTWVRTRHLWRGIDELWPHPKELWIFRKDVLRLCSDVSNFARVRFENVCFCGPLRSGQSICFSIFSFLMSLKITKHIFKCYLSFLVIFCLFFTIYPPFNVKRRIECERLIFP